MNYKSRYDNFGFYADGVRYKFSNGLYSTTDKKLQAVLDKLSDVTKVNEPKLKAESKPKASAK